MERHHVWRTIAIVAVFSWTTVALWFFASKEPYLEQETNSTVVEAPKKLYKCWTAFNASILSDCVIDGSQTICKVSEYEQLVYPSDDCKEIKDDK